VSLFSTVADFLKPAPPLSPAVEKALERIDELVSPLLKSVSGFEHKLSGSLEYALGYCDGLISGLPGPIDLNRQAFSNDPLVHALFATASDIDQMLGRSQAVRDYWPIPAAGKARISTRCLPPAASKKNKWACQFRAMSCRPMSRNWFSIFPIKP
jgi:hypothetical protein